jgi:glycerol kinase
MPDFILSIDPGHDLDAAILFDLKGEQQGIAQKELPQIFRSRAGSSTIPEEIWRAVQQVCRDVIAKRPAGNVRAIGITNQREPRWCGTARPARRSTTPSSGRTGAARPCAAS